MMTTLDERIRYPRFNNWVRSAMTLDIARDAVQEWVESKIKTNHQLLMQNIPTTCFLCDFRTCKNCIVRTCTNKELKKRIINWHAENNPSFDNTNPEDCWFDPWEFAKCFMPPNRYKDIHTASDTDLPGLIDVVVNNLDLRTCLQHIPRGINLLKRVKDIHSTTMHNLTYGMDKTTFKEYAYVITAMLNCIPITERTKHIISKIDELITISPDKHIQSAAYDFENIKLSNDNITITEEDSIRVVHKVIESLATFKIDMEHSISEMTEFTKQIEDTTNSSGQDLVFTVKEGVLNIKTKAQEKVGRLHDGTGRLMEYIQRKKAETANNFTSKQKDEAVVLASTSNEGGIKKADSDKGRDELTFNGLEVSGIRQNVGQHLRDFKSEQQNILSHMENISQETEQIATFKGDSNSSTEKDKPNGIEDKHMESSGIKQEGERRKVFDNLDMQMDSDQIPCIIKGMVTIGVDKLAVVDSCHERVNIINVHSNTITSFVDVEFAWDITSVNNNLLVIACNKALQFLELKKDKLSVLKKRFELTDRAFWALGVDYTNVDKLFAVYFLPSAVRIINSEGNTVREFKLKQDKCSSYSTYIKFSNDGRRLYVMDQTEYKFVCLNSRDGTILHRYTFEERQTHVCIAEDKAENVYIVEKYSCNIYTFSPDGSARSILSDKHNAIYHPSAITYCDRKDALYVCHQAHGKVVVSIRPLNYK